MALRYLLDENLRGPLWKALVDANQRGESNVEITRVGDEPDLPSRDRRPMSSVLRRHEILLPLRFNEDGQGVSFSPIVPCRVVGRSGTIAYRADRRAPCRSRNPLAIVFPDDMIENFTALVAGVAQSVEQRFCKP